MDQIRSLIKNSLSPSRELVDVGPTWYDVDDITDLFKLCRNAKIQGGWEGTTLVKTMIGLGIWEACEDEGRIEIWMSSNLQSSVTGNGSKEGNVTPPKPPSSELPKEATSEDANVKTVPRKPPRSIIYDPVTLVPYLPLHVPAYNKWMSSPTLLELTASESLSLEEEYEMCETWRSDDTKHTFIIYSGSTSMEEAGEGLKFVEEGMRRMVGDVNMFVRVEEEVNDEGEVVEAIIEGEIEIMIAEETARRKGLGERAVGCMIEYGKRLGVERIFVKIGDGNVASRILFEEKLGFQKVRYVECFQETELELRDLNKGLKYEAVEIKEPK
jgi:RimJ/RimL family protein N-acetyltransferase